MGLKSSSFRLFINVLVVSYALNAEIVMGIVVWFTLTNVFIVQINIVVVKNTIVIRRQFVIFASVILLFLIL